MYAGSGGKCLHQLAFRAGNPDFPTFDDVDVLRQGTEVVAPECSISVPWPASRLGPDIVLGELSVPGGTAVFIGLPGGQRDSIRLSIAAISNWEKSIRGSNVGTRQDLQEAVDFAVRGLVAATVETLPFDQVNEALSRLRLSSIREVREEADEEAAAR